MMNIGIVGGGVVGRATARSFIEHCEVRVYDILPERSTHSLHETIVDSDLVFVCLPTPQSDHGKCDLTALHQFFGHCVGLLHSRNFVLKSTVPIGTTAKLAGRYNLTNLVHSPEFLTARCAVTDAQLPSRNIIGRTSNQIDNQCSKDLYDLYNMRFPGVPIHLLTSNESEAIKLFTNGFFSVKIAYWNEVAQLSRKIGMDWDNVLDGILSDGRIAHSHTKVPGPDGRYGFGGECLPKDLSNLYYCLVDNDIIPHITAAAISRNRKDRITEVLPPTDL